MVKGKNERLVTQSLLDRLTGQDEWPTTRNSSLRMYRDGIKRDVEWLLNSRKPHVEIVEQYPAACASVFNYGLPDVTQLRSHDANSVLLAVLKALRTYEPRIRDPRVHLVRLDDLSRSIRFHIDGRMALEDSEEEISFDTVLEIVSGGYEVK